MIDLSGYAKYLRPYFSDKMDVFRLVDEKSKSGATNRVIPKEPQQKDVPCRISFAGSDPALDEGNPAFKAERVGIRIFCGTEVDLRAGDTVHLHRPINNRGIITYRGKVGRPDFYDTHQEAEFEFVDMA
jgi:hypothetical protein